MKRRTPSAVPERFAVFDFDAWADKSDPAGFYRYEAALHRWIAARNAWAAEHGFDDCDREWMAESDAALIASPDAPWDPSRI